MKIFPMMQHGVVSPSTASSAGLRPVALRPHASCSLRLRVSRCRPCPPLAACYLVTWVALCFSGRRLPSWSQLLAVTMATLLLTGCGGKDEAPADINVSERPVAGGVAPVASTTEISRLGLRLRMPYQELATTLQAALPETQTGDGRKRVCKRALGIKVCGTAEWQFTLRREGLIEVNRGQQGVSVRLPFALDGQGGVRGDVARVLGLSRVDLRGAMALTVDADIDIDADWCPRVNTRAQHEWLRAPKLEWFAGVRIDVRKQLDELMEKELAGLDERIAGQIDCNALREQISSDWKHYSIALDLPGVTEDDSAADMAADMAADSSVAESGSSLSASGNGAGVQTGNSTSVALDNTATGTTTTASLPTLPASASTPTQLYLNVVPQAVAFSGLQTEGEDAGFAFELEALTTIAPTAIAESTLPLPPLGHTPYHPGRLALELPIRVGYEQLQQLASEAVVGRTFTQQSVAGDVSVAINSVEIYPSAADLVIGLHFSAQLPATGRPVAGSVYLAGTPLVDAETRHAGITDLQVSPVLDHAIWNGLASVFQGRIIRELETRTVINLADRLTALELDLLAQLEDPARTRGLQIAADNLYIDVVQARTEADALMLALRVSANLDIVANAASIAALR